MTRLSFVCEPPWSAIDGSIEKFIDPFRLSFDCVFLKELIYLFFFFSVDIPCYNLVCGMYYGGGVLATSLSELYDYLLLDTKFTLTGSNFERVCNNFLFLTILSVHFITLFKVAGLTIVWIALAAYWVFK